MFPLSSLLDMELNVYVALLDMELYKSTTDNI